MATTASLSDAIGLHGQPLYTWLIENMGRDVNFTSRELVGALNQLNNVLLELEEMRKARRDFLGLD